MPPAIAFAMDEAEAVSRGPLLDTATVAAAGKVDEHSVGYISASVAYNQVSRGVDPKIAILVVSICGLESKTCAVLRRATQHVLLQSSGSSAAVLCKTATSSSCSSGSAYSVQPVGSAVCR